MSVPVSVERLGAALEDFGDAPYLLTVADDGRPHAVGVVAAWDGGQFRAGVGRRSAANAAQRPLVSLVWPPFEPGGYSLIVDGHAEVTAGERPGDSDAEVSIAPTKAVLHRAATAPVADAGACGSDCVPLAEPAR